MKNTIWKTLEWVDWNAFVLLWFFSKNATRAWWTVDEIREVTDDAMSWDYNHLVVTIESAIS